MAALAEAEGARNVTIINTCAVTSEAERQSAQAVRKAKREEPESHMVVTGCAAQVNPERFSALEETDRLLGAGDKLNPAAWRGEALVERDGHSDVMAHSGPFSVPPSRRAQARARAHLQVQNGCDHRCTFCIIPFGRGRARSLPIADAVAEARRLTEAGHKEIVLTGVDLTSWGQDLDGPQLGDLVAGILEGVPELPRLRLSSVDGIEIDPLLEELIVSEPRLQPFLHLSLQSGDDLILKRMKRRHSRAQAIELCHRLKAARPELAFGADIIAGFPTESDQAFERSCTLIEACGLSFVHVFPFSPRPGTPAARMPQLSRPLIKERAAHLRGLAERARAQRLAALEGVELDILVEEAGRGRTPCFAEVNVPETPDWAPGRLARACLGPSGDGRRASIITDKALEEMAA